MPSVIVPRVFQAVTVATAKGVLTVGSTTDLFPGANAWVNKDDGSARARVKILAILSATTLSVRRYANDDERSAPNYGLSDMTGFNGASHLNQELQTAPVNPDFVKRVVS